MNLEKEIIEKNLNLIDKISEKDTKKINGKYTTSRMLEFYITKPREAYFRANSFGLLKLAKVVISTALKNYLDAHTHMDQYSDLNGWDCDSITIYNSHISIFTEKEKSKK
jgi:hypothetical protein